jgi:A/G-specific adenine glycosylase
MAATAPRRRGPPPAAGPRAERAGLLGAVRPELLGAVRAALLAWFARSQRALPWRERYEPYTVWVAEIMLQQTQVEAVRPYFERWLARFPDVQAVAAAPQEAVLKAWEGLGYYARARNLQRAAQAIVERHGGRLPESLEALLALPGIGRYTAGAIRSIAFDRPAPVVDGNVARVLGRLLALEVPARAPAGQRRLWALATALVEGLGPEEHPRDLNQGLMELGALVCRPAAPRCAGCPLAPHCAARAGGQPERFPPAAPRRARPLRTGALLLLRNEAGALLLRRRPPRGVWGGLWEPPWCEQQPGESPARAARRLLGELGLPPGRLLRRGTVEHGLTHFALRLACYRGRVAGAPPAALPARIPPAGFPDAAPLATAPLTTAPGAESDGAAPRLRWADPAELAALPLARLGRKALELAAGAAPGTAAGRND